MGPSAAFKGASGTHASTVAPAPGHRAAADMLPAELVLWFSHSGDRVSAPLPLLPRPFTHRRARPCGRLHGQPLTQLLNYCILKLAVRSGPIPRKHVPVVPQARWERGKRAPSPTLPPASQPAPSCRANAGQVPQPPGEETFCPKAGICPATCVPQGRAVTGRGDFCRDKTAIAKKAQSS